MSALRTDPLDTREAAALATRIDNAETFFRIAFAGAAAQARQMAEMDQHHGARHWFELFRDVIEDHFDPEGYEHVKVRAIADRISADAFGANRAPRVVGV